MAKLVALSHILVGNREYKPGQALPSEDAATAAAWVESGAAIWRDDDYQPPTYAKAKSATAEAGLPGLAVGGEVTGNELVGKVPATHERKRAKHGKAQL